MKKKAFKPKMVKGKQQRAATYSPGFDVICVRAPNKVIDRIRAMAKKTDQSISALVSAKFGFPTATAKKATKASPTKTPAGSEATAALQ